MGESFRDLVVWQLSIDLAEAVYRLTRTFPPDERFGLSSQMRRAAVSVSSNIAEGFGRTSCGEYVQSLGQARGSNSEIESQLVIGRRIGIGVDPEFGKAESLCTEVGRLLNGLIKSLRSSTGSRPRDIGAK
jgi:four helix bundle protein